MKNEKEWLGEWYIPVNGIEIIFYGTLKYNFENGNILKATSENYLRKEDNYLEGIQIDDFEIIKGKEHVTGNFILLNKCHLKYSSYGTGIIIELKAAFVIEGVDYKNDLSLCFGSVLFELSGLSEWINIKGIKFVHNREISSHLLRVDYFKPENFLLSINEDFDLQILFNHSINTGDDRFEIVIKEYSFGKIISKKNNSSFKEFFKILEMFRRLMSVLMDFECFPININLFNPVLDEGVSEFIKSRGIQVYSKPSFSGYPSKKVSSIDMLFTFSEVEMYFEKILQKWFSYKNKDDMDYVHWILSSNDNSFSEDTFLASARALEVFQRAINNEISFSNERKEELVKKIIQGIDFSDMLDIELESDSEAQKKYEGLLKKISRSLNYINEPVYRERLNSMIKGLKKRTDPEKFKIILGDWKGLVHKTVDKRNYYTHYGNVEENEKDYDEYFKEIIKLSKLTTRLNHLLLIVVLENLGIPPDKVMEKLINGKYSSYYQKL